MKDCCRVISYFWGHPKYNEKKQLEKENTYRDAKGKQRKVGPTMYNNILYNSAHIVIVEQYNPHQNAPKDHVTRNQVSHNSHATNQAQVEESLNHAGSSQPQNSRYWKAAGQHMMPLKSLKINKIKSTKC